VYKNNQNVVSLKMKDLFTEEFQSVILELTKNNNTMDISRKFLINENVVNQISYIIEDKQNHFLEFIRHILSLKIEDAQKYMLAIYRMNPNYHKKVSGLFDYDEDLNKLINEQRRKFVDL